MKIVKIATLSLLLITNFALADSKREKFTKNYLDFQMNYLSEVISIEKNKNTPDTNEIDKFLLCQKELPTFFSILDDIDDLKLETEEAYKIFSESKNVKKLNKELISFSKIMKSQDEEFNLFMHMMMQSMNGETEKSPEPFEEISRNSLDLFMGNMFIYANGCEQDLKSSMEKLEKELGGLGEAFDEIDETLVQ